MLSFIKQVFIVLLGFIESLVHVAKISDQTKCLSLNDEPRMVRPILTNLNSVEVKYYLFMISLDKCTESCNVLSLKYALQKTKNKRYKFHKVFNMITNKNEAGAMTKHVLCDCNGKFNSTACNSNQKWNNKTC